MQCGNEKCGEDEEDFVGVCNVAMKNVAMKNVAMKNVGKMKKILWAYAAAEWQGLHYGRPPNWKIGHSQSQRSDGPAFDWTNTQTHITTHLDTTIQTQTQKREGLVKPNNGFRLLGVNPPKRIF